MSARSANCCMPSPRSSAGRNSPPRPESRCRASISPGGQVPAFSGAPTMLRADGHAIPGKRSRRIFPARIARERAPASTIRSRRHPARRRTRAQNRQCSPIRLLRSSGAYLAKGFSPVNARATHASCAGRTRVSCKPSESAALSDRRARRVAAAGDRGHRDRWPRPPDTDREVRSSAHPAAGPVR